MEQLSTPYRIVLAGGLVFLLLWVAVLRPKGETGTPAVDPALVAKMQDKAAAANAAPGTAGLGRAVSGAKNAVAGSDASAARSEAAAGSVGGTEAPVGAAAAAAAAPPGSAAAPASASAGTAPAGVASTTSTDPSAPILASLGAGKAAVLLFSTAGASEDAFVRAALGRIDRHGGRVLVRTVPIGDVGDYEAITRGVQITQSPTVLVIGPKRTAKAVVGFTETAEIDQLVSDALRR